MKRHQCVISLQAVRAIAAGGQHTVAVTDSNVFAWGNNSCGQLGTRTFRDKAVPTEIKDLAGKGVIQVACGLEHTLFLSRSTISPCYDSILLHHIFTTGVAQAEEWRSPFF